MKDLICFVADKNMEAVVQELLKRHQALGISRALDAEVFVHPQRDPGIFRQGIDIIRSFRQNYRHGLLFLDGAWDGAPHDLQTQLDLALKNADLEDWACAIVIVPELEAWVWSDSPHVEHVLGWHGRTPGLRVLLQEKGLWTTKKPKPEDPKAGVEAALYEVRKPRSSTIYRQLARSVSVERCQDPAFRRFRMMLREWFGVS